MAMTRSAAAAVIGVSKSMIRHMEATGQLPPAVPGLDGVLVYDDQVVHALAAQRAASPPARRVPPAARAPAVTPAIMPPGYTPPTPPQAYALPAPMPPSSWPTWQRQAWPAQPWPAWPSYPYAPPHIRAEEDQDEDDAPPRRRGPSRRVEPESIPEPEPARAQPVLPTTPSSWPPAPQPVPTSPSSTPSAGSLHIAYAAACGERARTRALVDGFTRDDAARVGHAVRAAVLVCGLAADLGALKLGAARAESAARATYR